MRRSVEINLTSLGVVIVASVAEGVVRAQRVCQGAGGGDELAPRIVGIFYHARAAAVHKADYVILAVAEVEVLRAVVVYGNKLPAGIVGVQLLHLARAAASACGLAQLRQVVVQVMVIFV